MTRPPDLFDTALLARRRDRAARAGPADFLHAAVAAEITERLAEVNRTFQSPALVGPRPEVWAAAFREAGLAAPLALPGAETLRLERGGHDLIVHGLALHWANDPVGQLVQCRLALRPDGLLMAALFGGETLTELRAALAEAEIETLGGISPRVAPMGDVRSLGGLLQRAGLALPVADLRRYDVAYGSAQALMRDLRAMGESNVMRDRHRRPMPRAMLARASEIYARRFGSGDGRVRATFEVVFLTGWAPAASQPRPLRPGSAQKRLADALGTREIGSGVKAGR